MVMSMEEQAVIILEALDKNIQIDWSFEKYYISAIMKGLDEIKEIEKENMHQERLEYDIKFLEEKIEQEDLDSIHLAREERLDAMKQELARLKAVDK